MEKENLEFNIYFDEEKLEYFADDVFRRGNPPYYIFISKSGVYPFVKYEEHCINLNDYSCFVMAGLKNKLQGLAKFKIDGTDVTLREEKIKFTADKDKFLNSIKKQDYCWDLLDWEFLTNTVSKCNLLMLWLAFLETGLYELSSWFCEIKNVNMPKVKGNKVKSYLGILSQCLSVDVLAELKEEIKLYDEIKIIRNKFVHNVWEFSEKRQEFNLVAVIEMVSKIFKVIEDKAIVNNFQLLKKIRILN